MDWDAYEVYIPLHRGLPAELTRKQAKEAFDHLMEALPHRIEMLRSLLAANAVVLGCDDESIQRLEDWLYEHVEADPGNPDRLRDVWYSVVNDIGLFLGEVFIQRHPNLGWKLFTGGGKRHVAYHRHVIMGFTKVSNPRYNVDTDRVVAGCAHRAISGMPDDRRTFVQLLTENGKFA
ncbi:hypothetical protein [Amycolatopsis tucumanensis]|uniref:hypothetical protein n=1 Tax=Amycolatopsis tucumanensis TaxID=401106 RepID=UPI001F3D1880|nr:hypothetical protein [Amycolatopsis tucumanensis]MCF6423684.1 hypothetical protein [Amycolatopsis tucumanensis]